MIDAFLDTALSFLALAYVVLSTPVAMTIQLSAASLVLLAFLAFPLAGMLAAVRGWTARAFFSTTLLWCGGFAAGCVVLALGNGAALAPIGALEGLMLGLVRGALGGAFWLLPRVAFADP